MLKGFTELFKPKDRDKEISPLTDEMQASIHEDSQHRPNERFQNLETIAKGSKETASKKETPSDLESSLTKIKKLKLLSILTGGKSDPKGLKSPEQLEAELKKTPKLKADIDRQIAHAEQHAQTSVPNEFQLASDLSDLLSLDQAQIQALIEQKHFNTSPDTLTSPQQELFRTLQATVSTAFETSKLVVAAQILIPGEAPRDLSVLTRLRDAFILVKVEVGRVVGRSEAALSAEIDSMLKDDPEGAKRAERIKAKAGLTDIEPEAKVEKPQASKHEIEPPVSRRENEERTLKVDEVLKLLAKDDHQEYKPEQAESVPPRYEQIQKLGDQLFNQYIESQIKLYEGDPKKQREVRIKAAHSYISRGISEVLGTSSGLIVTGDITSESIGVYVDGMFERAGLGKEAMDISLEIEKQAAVRMLTEKLTRLNEQQNIYFIAALKAIKGPQFEVPEDYTITEADVEFLKTLTPEQVATAERSGTLALRNFLIKKVVDQKEQDFKNNPLLAGQTPDFNGIYMNLALGTGLDQITIRYIDGTPVLVFSGASGQKDLMTLDQTVGSSGDILVNNLELWDGDTLINQNMGINAVAYRPDIIAIYQDDNSDIAAHEQKHITQDLERQIRLEAYKESTILKWAQELKDRFPDELTSVSIEEMRPVLRALIEERDIEGSALTEDFWKALIGEELLIFRKKYQAEVEEIARVKSAEQLGTTLISLDLTEDGQILTLGNAGIDKYDPANESHKGALVLIRHLNKLLEQGKVKELNELRIQIGLMILNYEDLNLEKVEELISILQTNDEFQTLRVDNAYKKGDEVEAPTEFEAQARELLEHGSALYSDYGHFIRQALAKQYLDHREPYSRLVPLFVANRPWSFRFFGIPGTGADFTAGAKHLLPRQLTNFFGFDQGEYFSVGKVLPFNWSKNPWFERNINPRLINWSRRMNPSTAYPGHEGEGWAQEPDPREGYNLDHIKRIGVHDRIREQVNAILYISQQRLNVLQAYHLLHQVGGIEVDWFRQIPQFRLRDWEEVDEYRRNPELRYFLENIVKGGLPAETARTNLTETITDMTGTTRVLATGTPDGILNAEILKGTTTDSLLELMKQTVFVQEQEDPNSPPGTPTPEENAKQLRKRIEVIARAVMTADLDRRKTPGGGTYTIKDVIDEIERIDKKSPVSGPFDIEEDLNHHDTGQNVKNSSQRKYVKIGEGAHAMAYNVEDAREFVTAFHLARAHLVLHAGVYNNLDMLVRNRGGAIEVEIDDLSASPVIIDPIKHIQAYPKKWVSIDDPQVASIAIYKPHFLSPGVLATGQTRIAKFYSPGQITLRNNITNAPFQIDNIERCDEKESDYYFGPRLTDGSRNMDQEKAWEGLPHAFRDALKERQRGVNLYGRYEQRAYETEHMRLFADSERKIFEFWTHLDIIGRYTVLLLAILALMNPAVAPIIPVSALLGTTVWSYTVSPFIAKLRDDYNAKRKAAQETKEYMMKERPYYERIRDKRHGTTILNEADQHLIAVRAQNKALGSVSARDFKWMKSNTVQRLLAGIPDFLD